MTLKRYAIVFKKSALKELENLPTRAQTKIIEATHLLSLNPFTELLQIKKLKGADDLYRFRIQDYRVLYTVDSTVIKIVVIKIGHRKEVYR